MYPFQHDDPHNGFCSKESGIDHHDHTDTDVGAQSWKAHNPTTEGQRETHKDQIYKDAYCENRRFKTVSSFAPKIE